MIISIITFITDNFWLPPSGDFPPSSDNFWLPPSGDFPPASDNFWLPPSGDHRHRQPRGPGDADAAALAPRGRIHGHEISRGEPESIGVQWVKSFHIFFQFTALESQLFRQQRSVCSKALSKWGPSHGDSHIRGVQISKNVKIYSLLSGLP